MGIHLTRELDLSSFTETNNGLNPLLAEKQGKQAANSVRMGETYPFFGPKY